MNETISNSLKNVFDVKSILYSTNKKFIDCDFLNRDEGIFFKFNKNKCFSIFKNNELAFFCIINKKIDYIKIISIKDDLSKCIYQTFMLNAIYNGNIVLHCSSFMYNGILFNFFGESNSGKSTILRFLKDKLGNNVYADDFLILKGVKPIYSGFYYKDNNKVLTENTNKNLKYKKVVNIIIDSFKKNMNKKELIFYFLNNIHNTLINKKNIKIEDLTNYILINDIIIQKYVKDPNSLEQILKLVIEYDKK